MALARLCQSLVRRLYRPLHLPLPPPPDQLAAVARYLALSHANTFVRGFATFPYNGGGVIPSKFGSPSPIHVVKVLELVVHQNHARPMSTGAPAVASSKVPVGARKVGLKVVMMSPGFVYEPYSCREPISFWKRWFTPSGWRRTKEDIILEMKSAYAVSRLRKKTGYTKKQFYDQALKIYKEVNTLMANGDTSSLRKPLTERMHSTIKNELKRRQSKWSSVYWELVEPAVSIRTLRARMIGLDKKDLDKAFIQLTLEFVTKQLYSRLPAPFRNLKPIIQKERLCMETSQRRYLSKTYGYLKDPFFTLEHTGVYVDESHCNNLGKHIPSYSYIS